VRAVARLCELHPGICLKLSKNHGKTSVRVAARTLQADTIQYNTIQEQNIIQEK
jgi:hypothetical protein